MKIFQIVIVALRIGLGALFIYGGAQKFIPKPERQKTSIAENLPDHVVKIKAYIGGLKQTDYFWPMLGAVEILAGIMLVSQYLALLGGFILLPVSLDIFLFHLYLEPHEVGELIMTAIYFLINLIIIGWYYKRLKPIFLNFKTIF